MREPALKLTTYFGERSRVRDELLAELLPAAQARHRIRIGILLRGIQSFGAKHRLRSDRLLTLSEDLPLVSVAIDEPRRIEALSRELSSIEHDGLVTLERAWLIDGESASDESQPLDLAGESPSPPGSGEEVKLTAYVGRHERIDGEPAFAVICQILHDCGVAGATVLLGVDGTIRGKRHRAKFMGRNAGVPLAVMTVGESATVANALAHMAEKLPEPLLTLERVRVCKCDGTLLQKPPDLRGPHNHEPETQHHHHPRHKLTVIASEATLHERRSLHLELVRQLRAANAAGATSMRGIWGFHGDHPPHGDRLLSIRRHAPVVTVAIDTPERISELFPVIDELTSTHGLVTNELIPLAAHPSVLRGPTSTLPPL